MKNYLLGLFIAVILVLAYVWQHIEVISTSYKIEEIRSEKEALVNKNKDLQVKLASMKSLDRIEKIAKEKLQLVSPSNYVILNMENGEISENGEKGVLNVLKNKLNIKAKDNGKFNEIFKLVKKNGKDGK